jgi:hypothetical protein
MDAKLLREPIEVVNRLHDVFGVTREQLIEVVHHGVEGRNECTPHHPSSMAGTRCWGDATKALRDLFVSLRDGWRADDTDNIPSVVNRHRRIKIAVQNTDSGTGLDWGHPQPINDKGDGSKRAAFPNERGFQEMLESTLNATTPGSEGFWNLCIFCGSDMVRAEMLCPIIGDDGSFRGYHARIALITDEDDNGGFRFRRETPESPDGDAGFEISVTRKQATL